MPRERIEEPGLAPKEKVGRLVERLGADREHDPVQLADRDAAGVLRLRRRAAHGRATGKPSTTARPSKMSQPDWAQQVLAAKQAGSGLPDQRLRRSAGRLRHAVYIPCLRTDDLVFHLAKPEVRERLEKASAHVAQRRRSLAQRRSASCSSTSSATAPGLRHLAAAGLSRRAHRSARRPTRQSTPLLRGGGRVPARSHARRAVELRLLDAGRVLCRVSACRST